MNESGERNQGILLICGLISYLSLLHFGFHEYIELRFLCIFLNIILIISIITSSAYLMAVNK